MACEPSCRDCGEEVHLSNRGLWKALCLDCAKAKTQAAVSRAVSSSSQWSSSDSSSECSCVPACCRECDDTIHLSNKGMWKALCLDCAKGKTDEAVSRAVSVAVEAERESASENRACCRDCDEVIGTSNKGLWKALCLECAEGKRRAAVAKAEARGDVERESEVYDKDCEIASLSARVRELEGRVSRLGRELEEKEEEMESKDDARREQITILNAALRRKNASLAQKELATEQLRRNFEREIAALRRTQEDHSRTCPAAKNELMLAQGETTTFADVCVAAGETVFHVHRAILASRSPVFASMLNLPMREGNERLVQIEDMSAKALEDFLFFLYTGRFRQNFDATEHGTEVLAAAHKYDVKDMEEALRPLVGSGPGNSSNRARGGRSEALSRSTSATACLLEAVDAPDGALNDSNGREGASEIDELNAAIDHLVL